MLQTPSLREGHKWGFWTLTALQIVLSRKLWDNGGDITSQSYAEREVDNCGVMFLTPDNENICKNQFYYCA